MHEFDNSTIAQVAERLSLCIVPEGDAKVASKWWWFEVRGVKIYCYNFAWRRKAIAHHDLHHIVTGYPSTLIGEMQVATWEFAAGRYPNIFATLFCLPLVAVGVAIVPKKVWRAFVNGWHSRSLFSTPVTSELLSMKFMDLREQTTGPPKPDQRWSIAGSFFALVGLSAALIVLPLLIGARILIAAL